MAYTTIERGAPNTLPYRVFFADSNGKPVSPFHDIPLYSTADKSVLNMVVEIPRWSNAKMEICKEEGLNPIKQDVKKGALRFVKNIFPHHGYIWNYGALPQTWEDPSHLDPHTEAKGDADPLDVCEIGHKIHSRGSVIQVKVLGVMAMIDEGETDWKVIVIDVTDPLAEKLNDVNDVEQHMPGFLRATYEWFRDYKVPDGKPKNVFAFNGEAKDKAFAIGIVEQTHQQWRSLISKQTEPGDIKCQNTTVVDSPYKVQEEAAQQIISETPEPRSAACLSQEVNKWYYV